MARTYISVLVLMKKYSAMKSGGFHGHEIWQISWNLANFMAMKSGGFHGKDLYSCIPFIHVSVRLRMT